jgi:outer membrane protein assembly factor BamB/DNA-binding HxlR family transcriptional regulator
MMEDTQEDRQRAEIFDALGHPTRIIILKALKEEALGFADLKKKVGIDSSGHLQHHLNKLDGLIKTDEHGKYCLSDQGKDALLSVQIVEKAAGSAAEEARSGRDWKRKRALKLISVLLVVALVVVSSVAAFEYAQLQTLLKSESSGSNVAWTHELGVNIAGFTVAYSKTFTVTFDGDLYCFDRQSGQTLWSQSLGGYIMSAQIIVENGRVFTGSRGSILNCLSEDNGNILWQFGANVSSSIASKSPPGFSVADGKVFMTGDGFYVLNATDGKLLWEYLDYGSLPDFVGTNGNWAVADDRVFAGGWDHGNKLYCFDSDTGSILWQYGITVNSPPIISSGHVFVWNYDNGTSIITIDEFTGLPYWQFDIGNTVFQPTLNSGLLLVGDANGNFYALTAAGSLNWTYQSKHEISNYPTAAAPKILNNTVVVGYEVGYVTSLNLADGKLFWRTPVSGNARSLVIGNNELFVTSGASGISLYTVDLSSGNIQASQTFNYWTLPPIFADNKLYIAADLKVIAYK